MPITFVTRKHGPPTTASLSANPRPASRRSWLSRLLAGEVDLPTLSLAAPLVPDRPPLESLAVARALACPDLFVLDAPHRETRDRLIADLLKLAAERGETV